MKKDEFREHLKENPKLRKRLRVLGVILTAIGGLFMLIAFIDFFASDFPTLFWLFFVGMIILFPGSIMLKFGFMSTVARYTASEMAPVKKDTLNYLIGGTREEISKTIKSFKEDVIVCPKCNETLDKDSKFCNHCGYKLTKTCEYCNTDNDSDSKFCKKCGKELG